MPYMLKTKGSEVCVHKKNPDGSAGKEIGCHPNRDAAKKQLSALYAKEGSTVQYSDVETFYLTLEDEVLSFADIKLDTQYRRGAAKSGVAMSDGSFPIPNCDYAMRAIRSIGRAPEGKRSSVRSHIRKRVKALGCKNVPEQWRTTNASERGIMHPVFQFADAIEDDSILWFHAFPFKTYQHPIYGEVEFTKEQADRMAANFATNVIGQELTSDYEHGLDSAKGSKASGTFKEVEVRDDGLWVAVEPTSEARQEIKDGAWRYFSVSFKDVWEHPETKEVHEDVLWGGGLTNFPYLKGVAPINFSDLAAEVAEKEHSEPGTLGPDNEPIPRERESEPVRFLPQTDPKSDENNPEGSKVMEEGELRELLGAGPDDDLKEHIAGLMSVQAEKEREKAKELEATAFSETYPDQAAELADLRDRNRKRDAKEFADSFAIIEKEGRRYTIPVPVREKLEAAHLEFSEGKMDVKNFTELSKELTETQLVELSERGTSVTPEDEDDAVLAKKLSEEATKVSKEEKMSFGDAVAKVSTEHPEWAEAYSRIARPRQLR